MDSNRYKEDADEARDRLTAWWDGGDIGRPVMQITVPREEPVESIPAVQQPEGWITRYSTMDYDYRLYQELSSCTRALHLAEAFPQASPDLAPNGLALYLGCTGHEARNTVWCEPCIDSPETARFERAPDNFYWDFTLRLTRDLLKHGQGRFWLAFPDLIEGLDTLAAMRGTDVLLMDLLDRPAWVRDALDKITTQYFKHYDALYDLMKDDRGGSVFWAWAPGRMAKLQCDFSAMISPDMFGEFMVPVLRRMTDNLDYSMYHWDGPGAIPHHDHLLSLPDLNLLQWVPGAGQNPPDDKEWWPLYHKTLDAGKGLCLFGVRGPDAVRRLRREFGTRLNRCIVRMHCATVEEAEAALAAASG